MLLPVKFLKTLYKTTKEKLGKKLLPLTLAATLTFTPLYSNKLRAEDNYCQDPFVFAKIYTIVNPTQDFKKAIKSKSEEMWELLDRQKKIHAAELITPLSHYERWIKGDVKKLVIKKCKKHHKPRSENQKPKPSLAWIEYDKGEYCAFKVNSDGVTIYLDYNKDGIPDADFSYGYAGGGTGSFEFVKAVGGYIPVLNEVFGVCTLPALVSWVQKYTNWYKLKSVSGNPQDIVILEFDY